MNSSPGLSGADFWGPKFGFEDFDSFKAAMEPLVPTLLPFGNFGLTDESINGAWYFPYSTVGVLYQSLATAAGLEGPEKTGALTTAQIQAGAVYNAAGDTGMVQLLIPGCFQVAIHAVSGGQAVDNVIGVQNSGGNADAAAQAVADAWGQAGGPLANLPSTYSVTDYTATDIGSSNGQISVLPSGAAGSGASQLATNGACALIKWNGGTRSRSSRGRLYFGPIMETIVNADGRTLSSAGLTAIGNAFSAFLTSLEGSGYPLVVLSRKLQTAFPVTTSAVETVIATQRRRIRS